MAFILLLLLTITGLVRVETEVASDAQTTLQARQNAQLAVLNALGDLQKLVGPDQRVTATASMGEANLDGGVEHQTTQNGLVTPRDGAKHWTGVWGNSSAPDGIYSTTPSPVLLDWLISGNEGEASIQTATDGSITSPSAPNSALVAPDDSTIPALSNLDVETTQQDWQLLVGPGSVDTEEDYVVAPTVSVESDMPGRYAWWVGDEGVKARYNLRDEHTATTDLYMPDPDDSLAERWRLAIAQRIGVERMDDMNSYPINDASLDKVAYLDQATNSSSSIDKAALKTHFHDLTTYSEGVLSDTRTGGLRKDLSYHLANKDLSGNILPVDDSLFDNASKLLGPYWERMNSFYDQVKTAASGAALPATPATKTTHGLTPTIVQIRYQMQLHIASDQKAYIRLKPLFVLGNSYSVPLTAQVDFSFYKYPYASNSSYSLALNLYTGLENTSAKLTQTTTETDPNTGEIITVPNPSYHSQIRLIQKLSAGPSVFSNMLFRTPNFTLSPGELIVFTLDPTVDPLRTKPLEMVAYDLVANEPDPDLYLELPFGDDPIESDQFAGLGAVSVTGGAHFYFHMYTRGEDDAFPPVEEQYVGEVDSDTQILQRIDRKGFTGYKTTQWFHMPGVGEDFVEHIFSSEYFLQMPADCDPGIKIYADRNIRAQRFFNKRNLIGGEWSPNPDTFMENIAVLRWGQSVRSAGQQRMVLFDMLQAQDTESPILSLGALQHMDMTAGRTGFTLSEQPGYAFGNSWASPFLPREMSAETRDTIFGGEQVDERYNNTSSAQTEQSFYDVSYLLNTALWDGYFFSTVPQSSGSSLPGALPNGRLTPLTQDIARLQNGDSAAAYLAVDGAFNINSTSVEAWKAVLSSTRFQVGADNYTSHRRSLNQTDGYTSAGSGDSEDAYAGYRLLSDDEIYKKGSDGSAPTGLAVEIADQVRRRGPFTSLAHFVNRELVASSASDAEFGLKGALQTAIDNAGINDGFPNDENLTEEADLGSDASIYTAPETFYAEFEAGYGAKATGIPGWLNQADLLQALGPILSARSDTFTIRAYGDVLNPLASTGTTPTVSSRVWCEAVVQRQSEPIVRASQNVTDPGYHEPNSPFGRRFKIVSFRWLNQDQI